MPEIVSQRSYDRETSSSAKLGGGLALAFAAWIFYLSMGDSAFRIIVGVLLSVLWMGAGIAAFSKQHLVLCPLCLQENSLLAGETFNCRVCKLTSTIERGETGDTVTPTQESIEAAKTIGKLTAPPHPNLWATGVGCAGLTLALLFFLVPASSTEAASPPPVAAEASTAEMSVAHKLACINADQMVSPSDHSVASFQTVLNEMRRKRPSESESHLADVSVATWNEVKKREKISLLLFMQKMSTL